MALVWYAKQGAAKIVATALSNPEASEDPIWTQAVAGTDITEIVKEIRISGGERDYSPIDVFGANQLGQHGRPTIMQISFTKVYQDPSTAGEDLMGDTITSPSGYNRYQGGEKSSGDRVAKAVAVQFTDGTNIVNALLNNAYCTAREFGTDASGHVEESVTYKCLFKDYLEEDNIT